MKYLYQFALIALFSYLGDLIVLSFNIPIPGSIVGLILFFIALYTKIIKPQSIREVGDWLKQNLALFFVPACVGLLAYMDILKATWLQLVVIIISSTLVTYFASGKVAQVISDKERKRS